MEETIKETGLAKKLLTASKGYLIGALCLAGFSAGLVIESTYASLAFLIIWLTLCLVFVVRPYLKARRLKYLLKKQQHEERQLELKRQSELESARSIPRGNKKVLAGSVNVIGAILIIGLPIAIIIGLLTALIGVFGFVIGIIIFILLLSR